MPTTTTLHAYMAFATRRTMAYAGAAGALTTFIGMPLAGALFVLEITRASSCVLRVCAAPTRVVALCAALTRARARWVREHSSSLTRAACAHGFLRILKRDTLSRMPHTH